MSLTLAEAIARTAHAGQREKLTGDDYIRHVERVVALVHTNDEKIVAWLHDVLEDTPVTVTDLHTAGLSADIIATVQLLTRVRPHVYAGQPHDGYRTYIRHLMASGNTVALAVKIADLRDHLRPMDPVVLPASMRRRYERALHTLEGWRPRFVTHPKRLR